MSEVWRFFGNPWVLAVIAAGSALLPPHDGNYQIMDLVLWGIAGVSVFRGLWGAIATAPGGRPNG